MTRTIPFSRSWHGTFLIVLVMSPALPADEAAETVVQKSPSDLPLPVDDVMFDRSAVPQVADGRFVLPSLAAPTTSTADVGNGRTPEGISDEDFVLQPLPESGQDRNADWNWSVCQWAAADTFSHPRYFEDRMLERHGHRRFGCFQPAASGARFFGTAAMLPYLMTVRPACDCEYTLGYYRPGSHVPGFFQRPPYERDAVITQSAVTSGLILALP